MKNWSKVLRPAKHENVAANGIKPWTLSPLAIPTMLASAIPQSIALAPNLFMKGTVPDDFIRSASRITRRESSSAMSINV